MGLDLKYTDGKTPIDEEEKEGLLIKTITTKAELNEFEQQNIEEAMQWVFGKQMKAKDFFTEKFIRKMHERMFGNVWQWAGDFRKTHKNIGIDPFHIPMALSVLCDDALFWAENHSYPPDEIAIRFKHRIVSIHCFPNGNGRHSRLLADLIIDKIYNLPVFTWGTAHVFSDSDARTAYLRAIKAADQNDYSQLLHFARS